MPNPYEQYANDPAADRIRALQKELERGYGMRGVGPGIKQMPYVQPAFPEPGPILEKGPYVPKPGGGPYIKKVDGAEAYRQSQLALPKSQRNYMRELTDEEMAAYRAARQ